MATSNPKKLLLLYWILANICAGLIYKLLHKIMKLKWLWWVVVQLKYCVCVYSSTLQTEAIYYFKTSVDFYCTTQCYISEDSTLQSPLWGPQIRQIITYVLTEHVKAQYNAVPHMSAQTISAPPTQNVWLLLLGFILL